VRGPATVFALAVVAAGFAWQLDPLLALVPLVVPGLPAALLLQATIRHGDPYDVRYRYPAGSVAPHHYDSPCIKGGHVSTPTGGPMIDTDGTRDYAEEAAVRAESDAERASETAHERLVAETVTRLRALSLEAYDAGRETVNRLLGEVTLRLPPNVHRYELLARQQHTALLAASVAASIEGTAEYDLDKVARGVITGYRATHAGGRDTFTAGLLHATERVLDTVAEVAHYAQQAETDREVEQHEADLAARDWHPADQAASEADGTL
jgi:hypothetical protein